MIDRSHFTFPSWTLDEFLKYQLSQPVDIGYELQLQSNCVTREY